MNKNRSRKLGENMSNKCNGKVILYLMRHGQTILNKARRTQGWCDAVLTKEGIEVAINAGLGLSDTNFKSVYSSDLGRAATTAGIVIKENKASEHLELRKLEGLREVYFGKYEGEHEEIMLRDILSYLNVSSFAEAEEKYDFQKEYCNVCATLDETNEAENYDSAISRVMRTMNAICSENAKDNGGNVLVVAHGGIIRLIIDHLDKSFNIREMDNAGISKIIYEDGKFTVESVNDSSYSEKGKAIRNIMV
ncbi:sigF/sigE/sigG family sigma factor [Clostridium sp. TW13]|uniref:SigF/sigE/sigG family sigma factor n=1 Tax=Inconstantimicrobium mannanitabidum TaxID=1604901 RepID=A0ACB5RBM8_9CLOT|nr:sigF/sigE/sigG family sigma factor [Clostridium sp. TW13]